MAPALAPLNPVRGKNEYLCTCDTTLSLARGPGRLFTLTRGAHADQPKEESPSFVCAAAQNIQPLQASCTPSAWAGARATCSLSSRTRNLTWRDHVGLWKLHSARQHSSRARHAHFARPIVPLSCLSGHTRTPGYSELEVARRIRQFAACQQQCWKVN